MSANGKELDGRAAFECAASPSLALLKYWGKFDSRRNLPATPSLAVSLGALRTTTRVEAAFSAPGTGADEVTVGGARQPPSRYASFFDAARRALRPDAGRIRAKLRFKARSDNDFPTSSGLASSSSGFAALALACIRAGEALLDSSGLPRTRRGAADGLTTAEISAIARVGSASAARAVFGGFSLLPARGRAARPLFGADHWPELRILVALVSLGEKPVSTREAMERSRATSPYYGSWVRASETELAGAIEALERRDLERLGEAARRSYLRMFGAMLACDPPLIYWLPNSLALIGECEAMRRQGIGVWETMDAGPQVKMLCLATDAPRVAARIRASGAASQIIESRVGGVPELTEVDADEAVDEATVGVMGRPERQPMGRP